MVNNTYNYISKKFEYNGRKKLSKRVFFLLFSMNILVFVFMFEGVNKQLNKIENPNNKFTNQCLSILYSNSLSNLNNKFYEDRFFSTSENADSRCKNLINQKLKKLLLVTDISKMKEEISELTTNKDILSKDIYSLKYKDTSYINNRTTIIQDELEIEFLENMIKSIDYRLGFIKNTFLKSSEYRNFSNYANLIKEDLLKDYIYMKKMYNFKKVMFVCLFILPLIFLFYKLMILSKKKRKYIYFLVFKNLVLTTMIPTLVFIVSFTIYSLFKLIPENIVKNFFLGEQLIFLNYYIGIAVTISIFSILLSILQKRHDEKVKSYKKITPNSYYGGIYRSRKSITRFANNANFNYNINNSQNI